MAVGRSQDMLDLLTKELDAGAALATHSADLSDDDASRGVIEAAEERFGGLDVLVNNAGVATRTRMCGPAA